jgi:ribosomal protein L37E
VRCGACGGWIQVKGKKESSNVPIKCGECGSTSYLVA